MFARLRTKSAPKREPAVLLAATRWIMGLRRPCGGKLALRARFISPLVYGISLLPAGDHKLCRLAMGFHGSAVPS
jgi:hypothetical protein